MLSSNPCFCAFACIDSLLATLVYTTFLFLLSLRGYLIYEILPFCPVTSGSADYPLLCVWTMHSFYHSTCQLEYTDLSPHISSSCTVFLETISFPHSQDLAYHPLKALKFGPEQLCDLSEMRQLSNLFQWETGVPRVGILHLYHTQRSVSSVQMFYLKILLHVFIKGTLELEEYLLKRRPHSQQLI